MPITVETQEIGGGAGPWHAALVADGLTLDSFGTIYLPGLLLADGNRSNHNSSFDASLQFRNVRINCAVPLDHAVTFVVAVSDSDVALSETGADPGDPALTTAGLDGARVDRSPRAASRIAPGLARQQAVRTRDRYHHEYRFNAWPVQDSAGGAAQTGLYRSDLDALGRAGEEAARAVLEPRIAFAPELAGISPGLTPGLVIRRVVDEGEAAAAIAAIGSGGGAGGGGGGGGSTANDGATSSAPLPDIDAVIERVVFEFSPSPMTRVYSR
jgi:hypothetical protein